jgi:hypothetical protein
MYRITSYGWVEELPNPSKVEARIKQVLYEQFGHLITVSIQQSEDSDEAGFSLNLTKLHNLDKFRASQFALAKKINAKLDEIIKLVNDFNKAYEGYGW